MSYILRLDTVQSVVFAANFLSISAGAALLGLGL